MFTNMLHKSPINRKPDINPQRSRSAPGQNFLGIIKEQPIQEDDQIIDSTEVSKAIKE
jgi:hypothetical protein